jgi:hypothetical protein
LASQARWDFAARGAVAAGIVAAIGDIRRFNSLQKLVSYFGLNPRVSVGNGEAERLRSRRQFGHSAE